MIPFTYDLLRAPDDTKTVTDWSRADVSAETLVVSRDLEDFTPLKHFSNLRALWTGGLKPPEFEIVCQLTGLEKLVMNDIRVPDVSSLGRLSSLRFLALWGSVKTASLDGLEKLAQLEFLAIEHIPRVASLAPLGALTQLRTLAIHSAISYDASGQLLEFDTFAPLSRLANLEWLELVGVKARDESLRPLHALKNLKEVRLANRYSIEEFARLAAALPDANGDCLRPFSDLKGSIQCQKCRREKIMLTGKTRPQFICPHCRAARLERHVAEFEQYKASAAGGR